MEPVKDNERGLTQHKTMKAKSKSRHRERKTYHVQQSSVDLGDCSYFFLS